MSDILDRLEKEKWHVTGVDLEDARTEIAKLRADNTGLTDAIMAEQLALAEAADRIAKLEAALRDARGYAALALDRPTLHNRATLKSIIDALDRGQALGRGE